MEEKPEINKDNINLSFINKKVRMKCNRKNLTFEKKNYPMILENYIAKKEWEIIAEEANCVIGNAYHLRKLEENVEIPKYMNITFWIIFIFSLIDFIFLIIYTKFKTFNEIVVYLLLALILISCGIIIALMIYNYFRKLKDEKTIDEFIIEGMNHYMEKLNQNFKDIALFDYNHEKLEIEILLIKKVSC